MKTDKNSRTHSTTSGTLSHPEQAVPDSNHSNAYDRITERVIAMLESGVVPWRKPWQAKAAFPRNLVSGKCYRGVNVFLLHAMSYESPFWLTYRQAVELGGNVRRGEKACPVVFWKQLEVEDKQTGETEKIPMLKFYYVFNSSQCDGLKNISAPAIEAPTSAPALPESVIANMPHRPFIKYGMRRAFYSPAEDVIGLPDRERFSSEAEFYSTQYHEAIHSTGHLSRLNRFTVEKMEGFGSDPYCKEELIAEMGAAFLCGYAGIAERTLENSAAYLQNWLEQLRNDKKLIVQAAGQAQKAADFILDTKFEEAPAAENQL